MAKVVNLFRDKAQARQARKRQREQREQQVFLHILSECKRLGPPDTRLIVKILVDIGRGNIKGTDILAMYLYRKKLEE